MLRQVHLHGYFTAFHDGPIAVVAETVSDAVEAVTRQLKGFQPTVRGRHRVKVVGHETTEALYQPLGETVDIHLVPQFAGGKSGGFIQIIIGAVLVAGSFLLPGPWAPYLMATGAMLMLGGLVQLLSPAPGEEKKSRYLGTPKNTVEIGTRIPILYGEDKVYGHYLSFDVDALKGIQ